MAEQKKLFYKVCVNMVDVEGRIETSVYEQTIESFDLKALISVVNGIGIELEVRGEPPQWRDDEAILLTNSPK